jgi:transposase
VAADYETLLRDVRELRAQLAHKTTLVESLTAEVLRLRRWTFGRSAEKVDLTIAPELPLEGAVAATSDGTAAAPTLPSAPPRLIAVDTASGRSGKRRAPRDLPPELPRVIRIHQPASCQCPDCGSAMRRLGEDTSEQLDYVPGYFQVIRHVRPKLACGACARIVQAEAPSRPIERGLPTAALLAQVIGAKYADHCPLYRQEGIYRRAGVELPRATLASWGGGSRPAARPAGRRALALRARGRQAACRRHAGAGAGAWQGPYAHRPALGLRPR